MKSEVDVLVRLPDEHRAAFKDPLGPLHTEIEELVATLEGPLICVGDVVSYHFELAGRVPDIAVIDGRTKRSAVDPEIESVLEESDAERIRSTNPPGTLTVSLVEALATALERSSPVQIVVDGEEDLAAIPAILLAPPDATIVYGQPGEGMVRVVPSADARERARALLGRMAGDHDRLDALLRA